MKVSGINNTNSSSSGIKKTSSSGGKNFSDYMKISDTDEAEATEANSGVTSVNPLFMLQEVNEDARSRKKKTISRGFDILAYLDQIKFDLLSGNMNEENIKNLENSIQNWREKFSDPELDKILDEIELRAAVELAKL